MDEGRLRVAAALLLTGPFTPLLFPGEEWGASSPFSYFTDHADPELGRAVAEGRRREFAAFGWDPADIPDPQDEATFEASRLDWSEPERPPHAGLLAWYRELIALRRRRPALSDPRPGSVRTELDLVTGTLAVRRGPLVVLVNLGRQPHRFGIPPESRLLARSDRGVSVVPGMVSVPPDAVAVVEDPGG